MRKSHLGIVVLSIALAGLTSPARAQEELRVRAITESGTAFGRVDWKASYVDIKGLGDRAIEDRIGDALFDEVNIARRAAFTSASDYGASARAGLEVRMEVGLLTPRLLSVLVSRSIFIVGTPYPNNEVHTLTFDLRTGAPVPVRGLFAPGDAVMSQVAARVDRALRAQDPRLASALPPIEAKHVTNVRVERDGMTFYFDHLPHALGLPSVKLTFAQLSGLVRVMSGELAVTAAPSRPPVAGTSPGLAGAVTRDGR